MSRVVESNLVLQESVLFGLIKCAGHVTLTDRREQMQGRAEEVDLSQGKHGQDKRNIPH